MVYQSSGSCLLRRGRFVKVRVMNNLFLFCGEDSFSAYQKLKIWREKFVEKYDDLNYELIHGADLTAANFKNAIATQGFLTEKKLLVIMDFLREGKEDERSKVADALANIDEDTVVVFFEHQKPDARTSLYKKLKKQGQVEEFKFKSEPELADWLNKRFTAKNVACGPAEIRMLIEYVGANLWNLDNEVQKLTLYAGEGGKVSAEMIEDFVSPNLSSTVFKLTDYLGAKNVREALKVFKILAESGQEVVGVLFMLVRHFRIMAQVKELSEQGMRAAEIARKIKEHPFVVNKMMPQVRKFNIPEIRKIYAVLGEIDAGIKTGRIRMATGDTTELEREMEMLMVKACA